MKKSRFKIALLGCFLLLGMIMLSAGPAAAKTDSGSVSGVWACWYWDWMEGYPYDANDPGPSLFDDGGAMNLFDQLVSDSSYTSYAQWWEYQYHGPPQSPDAWWGHCHAWSGAAVWEKQPNKAKKVKNTGTGVVEKFRIRDRKGLMCEAYYNDTGTLDFSIGQPSPGLMWYALRQEIKGKGQYGPIWGKRRGFVGELYYDAGAGDYQVWNYPIYKYKVTYWGDNQNGYYGYLTIWFTSDGNPVYADKTKAYSMKLTYGFDGVFLDQYGMAYDGGTWIDIGNPPQYLQPDSIWRPQPPVSWETYAGNPYLYNDALNVILYLK